MKHKLIILNFLLLVLFSTTIFSSPNNIEGECDSLEVLKKYSLFSEYHKNKDYESALPYGFQVLECNPKQFAKWIFYKMEDCLWYIHDSTEVSPEELTALVDTMDYVYTLAVQYYPDGAGYFQSRDAFVTETWGDNDPETVIGEYEEAFAIDPTLSTYYYNRLGQLYIANMSDDNDYKQKAIDLYSMLAEREPDNPNWPDILGGIVEDMDELLDIHKRTWDLDKENLGKAWGYASMCIRAQNYERAIEPLEFLVEKSPETLNYWSQLATAYQKTNQLNKSESALMRLIELDPDNKDYYLNLGIVYKEQGKLSKARQYFQTASEKGGNWGLPIYYEGNLYEQAARGCEFDIKAKMVFLLAVETYRKAFRIDPSVTQARDRANALSTSVPTQEDWFFHGYKSGQSVAITGDCYSWIGKSVTVP